MPAHFAFVFGQHGAGIFCPLRMGVAFLGLVSERRGIVANRRGYTVRGIFGRAFAKETKS